MSKVWRVSSLALVVAVMGCSVILSAQTTGSSYALDYREMWDKANLGFVDLLSAGIVQSGSMFVFSLTLYDDLSGIFDATYGFKIRLSDPSRAVGLEVSGGGLMSQGWTLSVGQFDDEANAGRLPSTGSLPVFCDDCVTAQGSQVTFAVSTEALGASSSFLWFVYSRYATFPVLDTLTDDGAMIHWSLGNPADPCSALQVEILPDRSEYAIGDEITIMLYVGENADIVVTDTAAGVVTTMFEGRVQQGLHSLADLMNVILKAWYPTGVETLAVIARTDSGCQQEAVSQFTVTD